MTTYAWTMSASRCTTTTTTITPGVAQMMTVATVDWCAVIKTHTAGDTAATEVSATTSRHFPVETTTTAVSTTRLTTAATGKLVDPCMVNMIIFRTTISCEHNRLTSGKLLSSNSRAVGFVTSQQRFRGLRGYSWNEVEQGGRTGGWEVTW